MNFRSTQRALLQKRSVKLLIFNICLFAFVLLQIWVKPVDHIRSYVIERKQEDMSSYLLYGDKTVCQSFTCWEDIDAIEIYVSALNDNYHGKFDVRILGLEGDCLQYWETEKSDIVSERRGKENWIYYDIPRGVLENGKEYMVEITAPELDEQSAIQIYAYTGENGSISENEFANQIFSINGESNGQTLRFAAYRDLGNPFLLFSFIILFLTSNMTVIFWGRHTYIASCSALLGVGMIMMLIMAPGAQPDEHTHYYSAYKLSNIILGQENANVIEEKNLYVLKSHFNSNENYRRVLEEFWKASEGEENTTYITWNTYLEKQPIAYIAPAMGISIGRLLHGSFIFNYELGRLFNLLFYIIMVQIAIRMIPVNKMLMLLIGIVPMAMHQAASLSYDVMINGLSLLLFAYLMNVVCNKPKITWVTLSTFVIILSLLAPIKVVYFVFVFLFFMIPKSKFSSTTDRLIKGSMAILCVAILVYVSRWFSLVFSTKSLGIDATSAGSSQFYTINYALENPIAFAKIVMRTIEFTGWNMIQEEIGAKFAGLQVFISDYLIIGYLVVLIAAALRTKGEEIVLDVRQKMIGLTVVTFGCALLVVALGLVYTTYGLPTVSGLQGRYFIPFLPIVLYLVAGRGILAHFDRSKMLFPVWIIEAGIIVDVMCQITI